MSSLLSDERLTCIKSSKVPAVPAWATVVLIPDAYSGDAASSASSASSTKSDWQKIDKQEPCFVTKSSCYTHEKVHWVNAARRDPAVKKQVEDLLFEKLGIVHSNFSLDGKVNLAHLDRTLHAGLDKYHFFAITGSLPTLRAFIDMFEKDNERRQAAFDSSGRYQSRLLDPEDPAFLYSQYELVALRPEHMLPDGKLLVAYNRDGNGAVLSHKIYVPGEDHTLRESPGNLACSRFPPFTFDYPRDTGPLNPLLVILNAEIKFRRYLRQTQPPPLPLPDDVMTLINLTIELVKLIYWKPIVRPNTRAAEFELKFGGPRAAEQESSLGSSDSEMGYLEEGEGEDEVPTLRPRNDRAIRRPGFGATLEERRDYGQYLLSGRNLPFDDDDERLMEELAQADREKARQHTPQDLARNTKEIRAWRTAVEVRTV